MCPLVDTNFYPLVFKSIHNSFTAFTREISTWRLEKKIVFTRWHVISSMYYNSSSKDTNKHQCFNCFLLKLTQGFPLTLVHWKSGFFLSQSHISLILTAFSSPGKSLQISWKSSFMHRLNRVMRWYSQIHRVRYRVKLA